jgi:hypothetical protein
MRERDSEGVITEDTVLPCQLSAWTNSFRILLCVVVVV